MDYVPAPRLCADGPPLRLHRGRRPHRGPHHRGRLRLGSGGAVGPDRWDLHGSGPRLHRPGRLSSPRRQVHRRGYRRERRPGGRVLFLLFAWLTLLLVVAAFANIVATTFASVPEAATSSVLFMVLAVGFGFAVYRANYGMVVSSIVGVTLLFVAVWLGTVIPIKFRRGGPGSGSCWPTSASPARCLSGSCSSRATT